MAYFYEELRLTREARNLTLKDVSAATKISVATIEALEQGEFRSLPQAYIRAFIKEYARFLQLDAEEFLKKYEEEFHVKHHAHGATQQEEHIAREKNHRAITAPPASHTAAPMRAPRTKRTDTNMTAIVASIIVVATGIVIVYFFLTPSIPVKQPPVNSVQSPPPIVPQYVPPAQVEKPVAQPAAETIYPKDSITLEATTTDSVWVSIVADTVHLERGMLPKGVKKIWRAKNKFLMTIGNSKDIAFTLNGKPLASPESAAHVIRNVVVTVGTTSLNSAPAPLRPANGIAQKKTNATKRTSTAFRRKKRRTAPGTIEKVPIQ